jgi:hypothetical protein
MEKEVVHRGTSDHGAMYYIADSMPHDVRPAMDELHPRILSVHILRAANWVRRFYLMMAIAPAVLLSC